jgi:predicted lipoprotein
MVRYAVMTRYAAMTRFKPAVFKPAVFKPALAAVLALSAALAVPLAAQAQSQAGSQAESQAGSQATLPADLGERLARDYARPAVGKTADAAAALDGALGGWCAKPDAAGAARVGEAFTQLALAWSGVEILRFGPLVQANRFERLAFWPDTRGVMPRQVQQLIAAKDEALLAPGALAGRSVAVQGLPALEYVLYGDPALLKQSTQSSAPTFPYACGYARAVAANVATISRDVAQAWSAQGDFGRQFAKPQPGNDLYRNPQEVAP